MNQQVQQKQDFKCKDHPKEPVYFWCKQADCLENRLFCLLCEKDNKHKNHFQEDVHGIHQLNNFLIEKSKDSKQLVSECQLLLESSIKSYNDLISALTYKFCGLEDTIIELNQYQISQVLDSLIQFDEVRNQIKTNIQACLNKFKTNSDDLFTKLELQQFQLIIHLIKYKQTKQIVLNQFNCSLGISLYLFY